MIQFVCRVLILFRPVVLGPQSEVEHVPLSLHRADAHHRGAALHVHPPVLQVYGQLSPSNWNIIGTAGHAGAGQSLMSMEVFLELIVQLGRSSRVLILPHSPLQPQKYSNHCTLHKVHLLLSLKQRTH